ncbi:alginate lyase family protein [Pontiellaceae bacterium B12227]|nr:alginate lyase family protein [Pontiellaceae bacterium B12227]
MKKNGCSYAVLTLVLVALTSSCTTTVPVKVRETVSPSSGLRHPGILQSKAMLDAMKLDLEQGHELRSNAWKDMLRHPRGKTGWGGDPWKAPTEILGPDNLHFKTAAAIVNSYALQWIVTGKASDAKKAIRVMNHWSSTLTSIRSKPDDEHLHTRLIMGIHSGYWAQAAELLRYSGAPWPKEEQIQFEQWLRDVILPAMEPRPNTYNGNWDASVTWSTMAIAVFLDDRELFDENIEWLKSGDSNARLTNYLLPSGQCQETGRDQDHAQMGLDFLARACEIAWNQGIDLYDYEDVSIGTCVEYLARYNLGDDHVPFEVYPSPVGDGNAHDKAMAPSDKYRGRFRPLYELVYHHYHDRKKMPMPYTRKVIDQTRIENPGYYNDYWNTLCFGDLKE